MTALEGAIDCDVHCAPASFEDLAPYLSDFWLDYISDAAIRLTGNALQYPPGAPTTASEAARSSEGVPTPSTYEALRDAVLERARPRFAILNCMTMYESHRNSHYAAALARAVNDWLAATMLDRDDRLRASIVVSGIDVQGAVAEIERLAHDRRFVQILLAIRGDLAAGHPHYRPLYEAAASAELPVVLHAWGRTGYAPTPTGLTTTYLADYASNRQIVQAHLVSLVCEGLFESVPTLRIVFAECGFAWLPALLWRFDKDWKSLWREAPWVKERPSDYVKRHMRATTAPAQLPDDPRQVRELVDMIGAEWLVYSSDYPHDHGDQTDILLSALSTEERVAVLTGNAESLYGLAA